MAEVPAEAGDARPEAAAAGSVALVTLSPTRRAIVTTLKRRGEARAEELATSLGITVGGGRQHLAGLEADGLVTHREVKGGPGRPKFSYFLAPASEGLFPRAYPELTNELLEYVDDEAPDLLERIFQRRGARRLQEARARMAGQPLSQRLATLAVILEEDGYLPSVESLPDGGFRLVEHNCAILAVAREHPRACASELEFLRAALGDVEVERVSHIVSGAYSCAYEVRPRGS